MGNTYQVRTVTQNGVGLPSSGGIIKEEHLNDEFTSLIAAFNASSGHTHNGTDSANVEKLGANTELLTTTTAIYPNTATIDVGTTGAKFRDGFFSSSIRVPIITDTNGAESLKFVTTGTAVNEFTMTNAATGNAIVLSATGDDSNIDISLTPKGTGLIKVAEGDLALGSTAITATAAELNIMDGSATTQATVTLAGTDGVVISDADVMKQALVSDFNTYLASSTQTLTNKTIDANGAGNGITNLEVADLASGVLDTDLASVSGSDDTLASAKAIKTYIDAQVTAQDLDFEGDSGGALSIDLDSETLDIAGGTGIDTSGSSNTLTVAIDSTVTTLTGTQTLTNKTLTAPKIVDGGFIADANGNELIIFQTTSSAVNELEITNAATGNAVIIGASGETNVDIDITPKGTGEVNIAAGNLNYASTAITATGAELNYNDITTLGTSQASKVLTADANNVAYASGEFKAKHYIEQYAAVTSGSAVTLDLHDGNVFAVTMGHNITFTFNNPPSNNDGFGFTLKLVQDGTGSRTATWPGTVDWVGGTAPTLTGTAASVDIFTFFTHDAGTTWYGFTVGLDVK
jgi:hypothetical protein